MARYAVPDRWEVGSAIEWYDCPPRSDRAQPAWMAGAWVGSGRHALRIALQTGIAERSWKRLWIPSYFCQHVLASIGNHPVRLEVYPDRPHEPFVPPRCRPGDAVLVHSAFGLRARCEVAGVDVIEDHSHSLLSPWARSSTATLCIASLRKLLPVADGGVVWSPAGHPIAAPPPVSELLRSVAGTRLQGMLLKARYLAGWPIDKGAALALLRESEAAFDSVPVCSCTPLTRAIVEAAALSDLERAQIDNFSRLADALARVSGCNLLRPEPGAVPFGAILEFESSAVRDAVRASLNEQRVYASALWPLDEPVVSGVGDRDRDLAARSFCIPVDARYVAEDMARVGELVARFCTAHAR